MADVTDNIAQIRSAMFGKDVRESIASSIEDMNTETESTTASEGLLNISQTALKTQFDSEVKNITLTDPSSAEIVAGRTSNITAQTFPTIGERIDNNDSELAQKANSSDVSTQIASVASGSPKGVYATLALLQSAFPTGNTNMYVVTADGKWYTYVGSAWTPGGIYQATGIADNSVGLSAVSFSKHTKNLFNKATAIIGYYISQSTGVLTAGATMDASDFIPVTANTQYSFVYDSSIRVVYYDINKAFISGMAYGTSPITTPTNTAFVRISFLLATLPIQQFELSPIPTPYVPYLYIDLASVLQKGDISNNMLAPNSVDITKANFVILGKNLFNASTTNALLYVNYQTGALSVHATYSCSDFIGINPSTQYSFTNFAAMHFAFYDINKTYISNAVNSIANPFTSPANAYYVRLTLYTDSAKLTAQVELGAVATLYEPFGYKLSNGLMEKTLARFPISLFLPSEICVAVGRTIELYNSQVSFSGNINDYHFAWTCTIGEAMKRKFSITGTTPEIGEYPLSLSVYDNNMALLSTVSTTLKIISSTIANPKKLLTIGDSLTNGKPWLQELVNLSGNKYTMVGSRGIAPLQMEGRSGWSAASYLTGASYTFESEGATPFWDGTRFNWSHYKTTTGINPDAIQIYLGTNAMALDPTVNVTSIKQIVDYIRQDDATIPIFIVYTLYRGNQDGIGVQVNADGYTASNVGVWKLQEDAKVYNLMIALNTALLSYTNLHFVPISLEHDSENNFLGTTPTPVNPRVSQVEYLATEATHPQTQGFLQMADIMFSSMSKYLNS